MYCQNVYSVCVCVKEREREWGRETDRHTQTNRALNSYYTAFKLKLTKPTQAYNVEYSSIHRGLHTIVKKKRGVRDEVKERELKRYYVIINIKRRKNALLDSIFGYENMIFTAAVILFAVVNGRFASTTRWQIIAPAQVTSLSTVFSITGSFFRKQLPTG